MTIYFNKKVERKCHVQFRLKYLYLGNRFPQYNCVQLPFPGSAVAAKCASHEYRRMDAEISHRTVTKLNMHKKVILRITIHLYIP